MIKRLGDAALDLLEAVAARVTDLRARRRMAKLEALGMRVGEDVVLPPSTWIDAAHCYLVTIGNRCRFGPQCLILAHDAQMDEFLDAGRLGRVTIGDDCRIGPRTVILCNVEIGPRTIVEAGSVVATSLPARSYCAGSPARVVCGLDEYTVRIEADMASRPVYAGDELDRKLREPGTRATVLAELERGPALVRVRADAPAHRDDAPSLSNP